MLLLQFMTNRKRVFLILALVLALFAAGSALAVNTGDHLRINMELSRNRFSEPGAVTVSVTLGNDGDRDFAGPITLYYPDGKIVEEFGSPALTVGSSRSWTGSWNVTQQELEKGKLTFSCKFSVYNDAGELVDKTRYFSRKIVFTGKEPEQTMGTLSGGKMYQVGDNIFKGEYILLATSDLPGYFAITSDAEGKNIILNENFYHNSIVTIRDGEYLTLMRCKAIRAEEFYRTEKVDINSDNAMLKVGCDLTPGSIRLKATGNSTGYYSIWLDSRREAVTESKVFDNEVEITVQEGQYLLLKHCRIQ